MLGRNVSAEKVRQNTREHRSAMRMTRANGKTTVLNMEGCRDSPKHLVSYRGGDPAVIDCDEQRRPPAEVASESKGFCMDALGDSLVWFATASVPAQSYRIIRRDIAGGGADHQQSWRPRLFLLPFGLHAKQEADKGQDFGDERPANNDSDLHLHKGGIGVAAPEGLERSAAVTVSKAASQCFV